MLVNLETVLKDAQKNKYGIGMFNTPNYEMAKAVITAAEEMRSPIIIGTAEGLLSYSELEEISKLIVPMAENATVPVVVHFDHGFTKETVIKAMDCGFTSVMYDCSSLSYEENINEVKDLVEIAKARGISVEAELGHVGANETGVESTGETDESIYTQPEQAKEFIDKTGTHALAVAIGSAHGAYKETPKLDIERLKEIAAIVDEPLVLHGGSGLSDQDFRDCIANGICKINIFTDINCAGAKAAYEAYEEDCGLIDLMHPIIDAVKAETIKKIKLFGGCNRC